MSSDYTKHSLNIIQNELNIFDFIGIKIEFKMIFNVLKTFFRNQLKYYPVLH